MSPVSTCNHCGGKLHWRWEEAFDKFGFGDGDGQIMTDVVEDVLHAAGYVATSRPWGLHNITICSIKRDGVDLIPGHVNVGYADPREYLPRKIVRLLDRKLPADGEVLS
jgi:hypothetical protein